MNKEKMIVVILVGGILLSGCGINETNSATQGVAEDVSNREVTAQKEQEPNMKLIQSSEDQKVKLFQTESEPGVTLEINGTNKHFNWDFPETGTPPQLLFNDLTGDGKEEAIVIIQTGRGTGLDTYDIHVVNANDLSEFGVQGYEEIVADQIQSKVKDEDGTLTINVMLQGKEYTFTHSSDPDSNYTQDELGFGAAVIYYVENQQIKVNFTGSVGASPIPVCEFTAVYKFDTPTKKFIVDTIEVKPIEN